MLALLSRLRCGQQEPGTGITQAPTAQGVSVPAFYVSMPAAILLVLGIAVINDGATAMGAVMIAVACVLLDDRSPLIPEHHPDAV